MIAEKGKQDYSVITTWIHKKISFSLIKSLRMRKEVVASCFSQILKQTIELTSILYQLHYIC